MFVIGVKATFTRNCVLGSCKAEGLQVYLARKNTPHDDLAVALSLWAHGGPRGGGGAYERGIPVLPHERKGLL